MLPKFKNRPACEGTDTELWFSNRSEYANEYLLKKICGKCPAEDECLAYALEYEVLGWWANTTASKREMLRKEQNIIAKPLLPLWEDRRA